MNLHIPTDLSTNYGNTTPVKGKLVRNNTIIPIFLLCVEILLPSVVDLRFQPSVYMLTVRPTSYGTISLRVVRFLCQIRLYDSVLSGLHHCLSFIKFFLLKG